MTTHIATIYSVPLDKKEAGIIEQGFFELDVHVDMEQAKASGDADNFIKLTIAAHLAECVNVTKLPLDQRLWRIEFTPFLQSNFNYPERVVS